MKLCQKHNCERIVVIDEYCDIHIIEEERLLKEEQECQFRETEIKDRELLESLEIEKVLELSRRIYYKELKDGLNDEIVIDEKNCFTIKFQFPNGLKNVNKFKHDVTVKTLINYVDVYIYDNNMGIDNYILVLNFPKLELDKGLYYHELKDLVNTSNFVVHIRDLNS